MSIYGNPVMLGGGGTNIIHGFDVPDSSIGTNGATYLKTNDSSIGDGIYTTPGFVCNEAILMGNISGRQYIKTTTDPAIVVFCKNSGYWQPHLASLVADGVNFNADGAGPFTYTATYEIDGTTWYFNNGNYGFPGTPNVISDFPIEDDDYTFSTKADAERFLTLAGVTRTRTVYVYSTYAKVNGTWQDLIYTDINNINLGASDNGDIDCYNQHLFSDMPYTAWVENSSQCSVTVDSVAKKVVFSYTSGDQIGQRFGWQGIYCPGNVVSLHYKITTGSSSYDQSTRFAPGIGILPYTLLANAVIDHNEYGAEINVGSFLKYAYTTQRNTTVEGTFDLTDVTTPFVLIAFGAGWNCEFSEIAFA